jgi:probable phosphoglycerate mutase
MLNVALSSGRCKTNNPDLKPLAHEARRILPPGHVTYSWVPREQNTHADRLANEAMDGDPSLFAAEPRSATAPSSTVLTTADLVRARPLYLVRHGQTADTVARRLSGGALPGAPLDDIGRDEAKRVAEALAGTGARAVVSSPTLRT